MYFEADLKKIYNILIKLCLKYLKSVNRYQIIRTKFYNIRLTKVLQLYNKKKDCPADIETSVPLFKWDVEKVGHKVI